MKDFHQQNYYELLDIPVNANQDEILNAYKKARAAYSGNSPALYTVFNRTEAQELLKLVDEAFAVLSNQYKRKEYNKKYYPHLIEPEKPAPAAPVSRLVAKGKPFVAAKQSAYQDLIPMEGMRNVSIKKKIEEKLPPGSTKFGKYIVNEEVENEIKNTEDYTGLFLQKVRIYKNISLDQMAEATKVNRPYLVALEASDYSSLPAAVFIRGFLVQVAKVLELDPLKVSISYLKLYNSRDTKK